MKKPKRKAKTRKKSKRETIVVFGAHSDDFVIGAGGTIAEYKSEKKKIISIIFSYGEKSHPWLKGKVTKKMRANEAYEASKVLGCKTRFFDLKEGKLSEESEQKKVDKKILTILNREKPSKLLTHSNEDPHPDHRAVNKITLDLYDRLDYKPKPEVYIYSIWNPVSFKTDLPALYVNISKTFSKKLKALKCFPSQRFQAVYPLMSLIFFRAIRSGIKIRKKFAEKFFRVK